MPDREYLSGSGTVNAGQIHLRIHRERHTVSLSCSSPYRRVCRRWLLHHDGHLIELRAC